MAIGSRAMSNVLTRLDEARRLLRLAAPSMRGLVLREGKAGKRWRRLSKAIGEKAKAEKKENKFRLTAERVRKAPVNKRIMFTSSIMKDPALTLQDHRNIKKDMDLNDYVGSSFQEKVDNIVELSGMSEIKAYGLASYLSHDYEEMNTTMRGILTKAARPALYVETHYGRVASGLELKEGQEKLTEKEILSSDFGVNVSKCKAAIAALKALPELSPESIEEGFYLSKNLENFAENGEIASSPDWGVYRDSDGQVKVDNPEGDPSKGRLRRVMNMDEDSLAQMTPGTVLADEGFTSSYVPIVDHENVMEYWREKTAIEMQIDWKKKGSSGKFVDHFKDNMVELEVLFPPRTKFEIEEVIPGKEPDIFATATLAKEFIESVRVGKRGKGGEQIEPSLRRMASLVRASTLRYPQYVLERMRDEVESSVVTDPSYVEIKQRFKETLDKMIEHNRKEHTIIRVKEL